MSFGQSSARYAAEDLDKPMNQFSVRINQVDVGHIERALETVQEALDERCREKHSRFPKNIHALQWQVVTLKKIIEQTDEG